jgi:GNAT superfamily N-acetyltransferase
MGIAARRWAARLENGRQYVRQHGLGAAARLLFHRHVYRSHRFIVTRAMLAGPPAAPRVGEIVFRLATPSDLDRLDELERYGRGERHRFYVKEDADWLFVACHGNRVVATRRYSRALPGPSKDGHGLTSRVIQLEPDQVWAADTFCLPGYRGQGVAGLLGVFAKRYLASLGYRHNLSSIAITNTSALRMQSRAGSERVCYVSYRRILFYERLRVSKKIPL